MFHPPFNVEDKKQRLRNAHEELARGIVQSAKNVHALLTHASLWILHGDIVLLLSVIRCYVVLPISNSALRSPSGFGWWTTLRSPSGFDS